MSQRVAGPIVLPDKDTTYAASTETTNSQLAAALTAMGIPFVKKRSLSQVVIAGESSPRFTWYFAGASLCGKYQTGDLIKAWEDSAWHERHPEHPFSYIKCAFQNYMRLIDRVKRDVPLALIPGRGGKLGLISIGASAEFEERILAKL